MRGRGSFQERLRFAKAVIPHLLFKACEIAACEERGQRRAVGFQRFRGAGVKFRELFQDLRDDRLRLRGIDRSRRGD